VVRPNVKRSLFGFAVAWLGVLALAACGGQSVDQRSATGGTSGSGGSGGTSGSTGGSGGAIGATGGAGGNGTGGSSAGLGGAGAGSGGSSAGGTSPAGMGGASEVVCNYGDQTYRPGQSFRSVDGCNTCYCANDGTIGCTLIDCPGSGGAGGSTGTGGSSGQGGAASCTEPQIGQICIRGRQGNNGETLSAGDELRVELRPLGCYSSSCTEVVRADCGIQPVEGGFVVTGGLCLAQQSDRVAHSQTLLLRPRLLCGSALC
jgi:hypothetical protein